MKMKRLVSAIAALAMSVSTLTAFAATAVTLNETTVTTTGTVADGVVTLTSGGNSSSDVSQNATIDLGTIEEGIVTLNFTWGLGSATGTRGRSVVAVQDDNGNDIFRYQYDGQDKDISFNGVEYNTEFARNQTRTVTAVINLYTSSVTVTGMDNDSTTTFYNAAAANVGQIYFEANAKASWTNTTTLSNVSYDVEVQEVVAAGYTINYVAGDTTVSSVTGTGIVGQEIVAETVITDGDGTKYFATDDAVTSMVIAADGDVLNVAVRQANIYDVTVDAVGDIEKNLVTDTVIEGEDYVCAYPAYIADADGNYYKAEGTTYGEAVTAVNAAIDKDVTYTAAEGVVAVIEGEDYVNAGSVATYSNGAFGNMASTNSVGGQVAVVTLPAGVYKIDVAYHNDGAGHGNRGFHFRDQAIEDNATNVVSTVEIGRYDASGIYSGEMTLTKETTLTLTGYTNGTKTNQSVYFDYVVITKTGDYEAPASIDSVVEMIKQYPESEDYEGVATALQATFTITGDASFNYVTVTCGEGSAEGAVTVVSGDGAEAVYGIVINALVEAADVTVAAAMAN